MTTGRGDNPVEIALRARVRQQAVVAELGQQALSGIEPLPLIQEAVRGVARTLDVDYCCVLEATPAGDLALRAGVGWCDDSSGDLHLSSEIDTQVAYTLAHGQPAIVEDYSTEQRFVLTPELRKNGVINGITVPMRGMDGPFGVLAAHGTRRRSFSPDDVHFLQGVANVLAAALERRRAEAALRESEERLRQSQKLEAVGLLAGGIAHDFNNLLTAVVGFGELLMMDLSPDDPRHMYASEIKRAGERASALTAQLLAFSRRQVLQPRVLDLNSVVTGVEQLLRRAVTDDVRLVIQLAPGVGRVLADEHQLEQVLLNLAVNARDAMPQGGSLTIQTANLTAGPQTAHLALPPGPFVTLTVSDTGVGMDTATRARLFEPFFTTKEPGKGTGLGLATVYGIVKQSGGEIEVQSELGHGTTFVIYLPAVEQGDETIEHALPVLDSTRGRETILLVEDEDGVRALARTVLQSGGYEVLEARRGEEALQLYAEHDGPIHLLVTDLVMPGMSGRELAERIMALGQATKVLYMSGYTSDRFLAVGGAYLQKPITPSTLAQKVREVLEAPGRGGPVDGA